MHAGTVTVFGIFAWWCDTLTALCTAPVHLHSLFPDQLITKAEEEISRSEERRSSGQPLTDVKVAFTLMLPVTDLLTNRTGSRVTQHGSK